MSFEQLRKKHPEFKYLGFETKKDSGNLQIFFDFEISGDIKFRPEIILPNVPEDIDKKVLNNLIFNLGMVELLSYWKATCSPKIIIKAGFLDAEQIKFWKRLLIKGLGEFFYNNKIDFTKEDLVNFVIASEAKQSTLVNNPTQIASSPLAPRNDMGLKDRDLILVGGGKDSAVTTDIWAKGGKEFNCLLLNPTDAAINIAKAVGCKNPIIIKRKIDPKLLDLNKKGYLNGHTPFSAYLAFLSTLVGVLYDYKNIVVSNESSSNEGNITWMGKVINHQYSKSEEFEKDFKEYSKKYLAPTNYYSFLRSLGEIQISKLFSQIPKYHKIFISCNRGSKQGVWCGKCPKCVSTYLTLYPFLGEKTKEIFGKDLLNDETLIPIVKGLLRENDAVKPFECVATVEEIKEAIALGADRAKRDGQKTPLVLESVKEQNLAELKDKSILILGFGREGQATLKFLSKHFPDKNFGCADLRKVKWKDEEELPPFEDLPLNIETALFGKDYLKLINDYQVIIKSPGIPYSEEFENALKNGKIITSATQIFFDNFKGKIIGVTGTKGKSTTSSLIYEVLKNNNLDVYLVGNIGKPALELLDKIDENSIVVYELSSFQLEDLTRSPHISVITNLYPEHLDHHKTFENYKKAKENITRFQQEDDFVIYNADNKDAKEIAQNSLAKNKYGYSDEIPLNSAPAIYIGKHFNIPDEKIKQALDNFETLPHRLEYIGDFKGIKFYNDSLSTIPQATIRALNILVGDVDTLIAGGFDRGVDYSILGSAIAKSKVRNLILFPTTGEKIWEAVKRNIKYQRSKIKKIEVDNMEEAVKIAYENTSPGKVVLLSPASTSFNLFKDYEDRGNQFKSYVSSKK